MTGNVSKNLLIVLFTVLLACSSVISYNEPEGSVQVIVENEVTAEDILPIGANLTYIAGGTNLASNNLIKASGMEPAISRYIARIETSGPGWINWTESLGGVSMWELNQSGFGDGAVIRLYRLVDKYGKPLKYTGGMENAQDADHVVFLGEVTVPEGGWIAESQDSPKNRVYISNKNLNLSFGDYAIITIKKYKLTKEDVNPRLYEWFDSNVAYLPPGWDGTSELVSHPGYLPADFKDPGETCLKVTAPEYGTWFVQWLFHGLDEGEGSWYSQLKPGASYKAEIWLRQEGISDNKVYFKLGQAYEGAINPEPWTVTGQWKKYTYEFTGPDYPDPADSHGSLGIEVRSSGTLWIDNFIVYRNDAKHNYEPFGPNELAFDELMASYPQTGPKPAVRFYPTTYHTHSDADHLLSDYSNGTIDFIYNIQPGPQMTIPHIMKWALATGNSPGNRIIPYITLSEEYTEVEWKAVVEYLGVPFYPGTDSAWSKPWAYKRYLQRGHGRPWTDEFREIILEFGNETWHNGAFGGWDGFGRPGWVWQGGKEYGLFARYYIYDNVVSQWWFKQNNLGNKIKFALNAGYDAETDSYGELAVQQIPEMFWYLGHANYVGPKWETEDEKRGVFDDQGMAETLAGGYLTMLPLIKKVKETRDKLVSQGLANYIPIAYEGGPSGYFIPGSGDDAQVKASELYGKSLGMAVSALDAWLYSSEHGYGEQAFLGFAGGRHWTSHTMPRAGGFRRHTGWLALMMRNLYATGDKMLKTSVENNHTAYIQGEEIPMISAYTIKDFNKYSVFVISRKLKGATPVTITLPEGGFRKITRYSLTKPDGTAADPAANNIDQYNVVITSVEIDASKIVDGKLIIGEDTGGVPGGIAPGSVYLYVIEK